MKTNIKLDFKKTSKASFSTYLAHQIKTAYSGQGCGVGATGKLNDEDIFEHDDL